jgi:hypothetical protein
MRLNLCGKQFRVSGFYSVISTSSTKQKTSNDRLNRRLMGHFKSVLDDLELRELPLHGRKFTWSSGQNEATMTKIDRFFYSTFVGRAFP